MLVCFNLFYDTFHHQRRKTGSVSSSVIMLIARYILMFIYYNVNSFVQVYTHTGSFVILNIVVANKLLVCHSLKVSSSVLTLVAEDPLNHTMSNTKATKVPVMRPDQPYQDWKKKLQIWKVTNRQVDKQIQAGVLFESLEGIASDTVLSELTVDEITADDGVEQMIQTLDHFFLGNETQAAYDAMYDLCNFKCNKDETMEKFIVNFQLKVNKVKCSGTVLPEGVLGFYLLNSANLSEEKQAMVKATCDKLTFKNVKMQLEKIGFTKSDSSNSKFSTSSNLGVPKLKLESCLYGDTNKSNSYTEDSSDDDFNLNGERIFYSNNKNDESQGSSKSKLNPTDKFGHVTLCTYCKCMYHWLINCPHAPDSIKNNLRAKFTRGKTNKTL